MKLSSSKKHVKQLAKAVTETPCPLALFRAASAQAPDIKDPPAMIICTALGPLRS